MFSPLPPAAVEMLTDLRRIARYLDHLADTALSDDAHVVARAHAIKLWAAIDRVEELAMLVEELAAPRPAVTIGGTNANR